MKKNENKVMLKPSGFCSYKDSVFFIQRNMNMLVEMDHDLRKIRMVKYLADGIDGYQLLYNDYCICVNDEIYILSNSLQDVYVWNFCTKELKSFSFMKDDQIYVNKAVCIENNNIVLFPNGGNKKLIFDCDKKICVSKKLKDIEEVFLEKCYAIDDGKYIFADSGGNRIHFLDEKLEYLDNIQVGRDVCRYWGIVVVGNYYVLPQMDENKVTIYDKKKRNYVELDYPEDYISKKGYGYLNMYAFGNKVYIFPMYANMIISIDLNQMTVQKEFVEEKISIKYNYEKTAVVEETYVDSFVMDNKVVVYEDMYECWHKFDCQNNTVEKIEVFKEQNQTFINQLRTLFCAEKQHTINEGFGLNSLDNFLFNLIDE